ncbi:MAG: serine/threonine protein phosphatase [Patescibacteria group bacterium]|nr:serine/threonine protein phosphatase [Patescibacteria group bacterium]
MTVEEPSKLYLDIESFSTLLNDVVRTLQVERGRGIIRGGKTSLGLIELKIPQNLVVVGDIHGDLRTLSKILDEINFKKFLSDSNNKLIFLGDYVDRGKNSVEVLYEICRLKQSHPDSVILMRGNHEAAVEFPFPSYDLPNKITQNFGVLDTVYEKILEFFQLLTLVVMIEKKVLLVHGGLPVRIERNFRESIIRAPYHKQDSILEDLLWNDPRPIRNWEPSRRKYGKHFGKSISRKWLKLTNTRAIVRGHEPCHGFKLDHDNMIITIFSCKESYPNFDAGYLYMTKNQMQLIHNAGDLAKYVRKIR